VIIPTAALAQGTPPPTTPPPGGAAPPAGAAPAAPAAPPAEAAPVAPAPAAEAAPAPAPVAPADQAAELPKPPPAEPAAAAPAEPPAEPPPPAPTITGYIDTGFHMELNHNSLGAPAALRAYDAAGGFMLHAAHLAVAHSFTPEASAFISLDFGSDAYINTSNYGIFQPLVAPTAQPTLAAPTGIPVDVREGYAKWTPGDFTLQAGKFVTLNGIEVVDGPLNPTLTRGFLFWLAEPVGHTGAKVNYALGGGVAHIGLGVANGWDRVIDNNNQKTLLFNADVAPSDKFHAQISGSWGAEQNNDDTHHRTTVDLTGAGILGPVTLNFQGLIGTESFPGGAPNDTWFGFGLQPVYAMDAFSLGARIEYFNDKHGSRIAPGTDKVSLLNFTITPGYMLAKSFTLRAEFRIDAVLGAKDATGADAKNILNGKSSQPTIGIGATYTF
jgi:hypothetical protein